MVLWGSHRAHLRTSELREDRELIALAKVAAKYGGIYATHMRNEGDIEIDGA